MSHTVEFIGGPLDGYQHPLPFSTDALATTVGLDVNQDVIRILGGEPERPIGTATSIAVYRLDDLRDPPRYYFLCSVSSDERYAEKA